MAEYIHMKGMAELNRLPWQQRVCEIAEWVSHNGTYHDPMGSEATKDLESAILQFARAYQEAANVSR